MADHRTLTTESPLSNALRLQRAVGAPRWGFFLRAETMHGFGFYCLDEPEAALSFSSTLGLIAALHQGAHGATT